MSTQQKIEIGPETPIAAVSALKKAGYTVTSGGQPVNISETDNTEQQLTDGKGSIHTKKWDRCVKKVKAQGKSEESAYRICSSSIKNAGVKSDHQRKSEKQYVANRNQVEVAEGETILDIFPELDHYKSHEGGDNIKNNKRDKKRMENVVKPKEVKPKKVLRDKKIESIMSKKEIIEAIRSASPGTAPSKPAPNTPTKTPAKPGQKPQRQNPFRPKPGPNPRPKATLPNWLTADKLGIGKNQPVNEDIVEIKAIIKNLI